MHRDRDVYVRHFERASLFIIGHLRDPALSVKRIASAIGLSTEHLHEVFRKATGATIGDYVRAQRLERCRRDLSDQSLRHQSSIAHRWGFSEASSLSREFRAAYQTSPRRYRRARQGVTNLKKRVAAEIFRRHAGYGSSTATRGPSLPL